MSLAPHIHVVLQQGLAATHVAVVDESHLHAGHAGARSGGGHYRVTVVSERFSGKPLLARHRAVNALLAKELEGSIHALALDTLTPDEWAARSR